MLNEMVDCIDEASRYEALKIEAILQLIKDFDLMLEIDFPAYCEGKFSFSSNTFPEGFRAERQAFAMVARLTGGELTYSYLDSGHYSDYEIIL